MLVFVQELCKKGSDSGGRILVRTYVSLDSLDTHGHTLTHTHTLYGHSSTTVCVCVCERVRALFSWNLSMSCPHAVRKTRSHKAKPVLPMTVYDQT